MTERDLRDDDVLVAALGEAFAAAEAGSPAAEALARSVVELGRIDGELAELVSDSYVDDPEALAVRAVDQLDGRILAYERGGLAIEIDLPVGEPRVIGAVDLADGVDGPLEVELISSAGVEPVDIDELGRFQASLPPGAIRFVVRAGRQSLTTPWITR
jgi:hypothetical protein